MRILLAWKNPDGLEWQPSEGLLSQIGVSAFPFVDSYANFSYKHLQISGFEHFHAWRNSFFLEARNAGCALAVACPVTRFESRKSLFVFDMDMTLTQEEGLDEIAKAAGVSEKMKEMTASAMAGGADFSDSLVHRVALLKGLTRAQISECAETIRLQPGASDFCAWLRSRDVQFGIATGGFIEMMGPIRAALGDFSFAANVFGWTKADSKTNSATDVLDGTVIEPIVDGFAKAGFLQRFSKAWRIPRAETCTVGDGSNDRAMFQVSGFAVGYMAKETLYPDCDCVLFTEGYDKLRDLIQSASGMRPIRVVAGIHEFSNESTGTNEGRKNMNENLKNYPGDFNPTSEYERNIWLDLVLTVITCLIYNVYVQYKQMEALNFLLDKHQARLRIDRRYNFWKWALLNLITLSLYHIYHEWKKAADLADILDRRDGADGIIAIVLTLFGFPMIADAISQTFINQAVKK